MSQGAAEVGRKHLSPPHSMQCVCSKGRFPQAREHERHKICRQVACKALVVRAQSW